MYRSVERTVLEVSVRFSKVADNIYLDLLKNVFLDVCFSGKIRKLQVYAWD